MYYKRSADSPRRANNLFFLGIVVGVVFAVTYNSIATASFDSMISSYDSLFLAPVAKNASHHSEHGKMKLVSNTVYSSSSQETLHVLFGMLGNRPSLYDAWEVAMKSVLVNAPTDSNLQIHVLCNDDAYTMVEQKIKDAELADSLWKNQITITSYNVEALNNRWRQFLLSKLRAKNIDERVSLGGYYRLLAYEILGPLGIGPTLYMDTDVIIMSNLNDLMRSMNETVLFQGSATWFCSGFVVVNMQRFHEFWEKVEKLQNVPVGDQSIFSEVMTHFPETFGPLPTEWDRNLGNGWRKEPHKILDQKEAAGMLHYQGGAGRKNGHYFTKGFQQYCDRTPVCNNNKQFRDMVTRSWGLGDFYTRLTWKWARFFGRSMIPPSKEGYKLNFRSYVVEDLSAVKNSVILRAANNATTILEGLSTK